MPKDPLWGYTLNPLPVSMGHPVDVLRDIQSSTVLGSGVDVQSLIK